MALRTGHGTGAGVPRIEVLPVDELPDGVPANARQESPTDRGERGKFARGNALSRKGGQARAGKTRLADRLGLRSLPEGADFAPYKASATSFRRAQCAALAESVGGGHCGPGPSSFVASAALQLAWSRYFSDLAAGTSTEDFAAVTLVLKLSRGDLALQASKLANDSRQNLLAAHELCAKEAEARRQAAPSNPHAALSRALAGDKPS